jgi:MacB-like periplasmic core domain
VRYALRTISRSPGFSAVSVLMMALGIGATTTFFSLAYGVLLRPLPWPEPNRVVRLQETRAGNPGRIPWTISNPTYYALREDPRTIEAIGGWMRGQSMTMTVGNSDPERMRIGRVTPSLFTVLRAHPIMGRLFADDDAIGGEVPSVVLLGFGLWQRRFGGAPDVVGRTLRLDDRLLTIVGIMPRDFSFPDRDTQAWLPLSVSRVDAGDEVIRAMIFNAVARLRSEVTADQAADEATARARAAPKLGLAGVALFGSADDIAVSITPARTALTADVRPALVILLGAVVLLFCTALASVLVLQSSRAARRGPIGRYGRVAAAPRSRECDSHITRHPHFPLDIQVGRVQNFTGMSSEGNPVAAVRRFLLRLLFFSAPAVRRPISHAKSIPTCSSSKTRSWRRA